MVPTTQPARALEILKQYLRFDTKNDDAVTNGDDGTNDDDELIPPIEVFKKKKHRKDRKDIKDIN